MLRTYGILIALSAEYTRYSDFSNAQAEEHLKRSIYPTRCTNTQTLLGRGSAKVLQWRY